MESLHCEAHEQKILNIERRVETLETAVFKGDSLDKSLKDRVYATEFGLKAMGKSIEGIANHMREQAADKRKLMLVIIGGSLTFLGSSILQFINNILGS